MLLYSQITATRNESRDYTVTVKKKFLTKNIFSEHSVRFCQSQSFPNLNSFRKSNYTLHYIALYIIHYITLHYTLYITLHCLIHYTLYITLHCIIGTLYAYWVQFLRFVINLCTAPSLT